MLRIFDEANGRTESSMPALRQSSRIISTLEEYVMTTWYKDVKLISGILITNSRRSP
jgi:hypothetical protein